MEKQKQDIKVVDAKMYQTDKDRYELHKNDPNAPLCPYGNQREFIGYDKQENNYVRFTKSVLLKFLKKNNK
ncbi:MAG TPA: hypothetical protein VN182_04600 [Flavobacterium sp.]|jgi:hypothetical protein|nr:hypothetical protein [Flavobacterium sp.]